MMDRPLQPSHQPFSLGKALSSVGSTHSTSSASSRSRGRGHGTPVGRLPEALKNIFIESNQGGVVHEPPKDGLAFKTFQPAPPRRKFHAPEYLLRQSSKRLSGQPSLVDLLASAGLPPVSKDNQQQPKPKQDEKSTVPPNADPTLVVPSPPKSAPYPSRRSPQVFLDVMLRTLGYEKECFKTLETSYFNDPTPLQTSSHHARLQDLVRAEDESGLRAILTCGISTNPCNRHGESLLHSACRNGCEASVRVMLECGATVQVSDDCGRTPLHSALFKTVPSFAIVDMILRQDRHLLQLRDQHGHSPLNYVPRDQWGSWIDFLYAKRHVYFPSRRDRRRFLQEEDGDLGSARMREAANSRPLPDPENALEPEMAAMVAAGRLSPEEARCLMDDDSDDDESCDTESYYTDNYTESGDSCDTGSWLDDDESEDLTEIEECEEEDDEEDDEDAEGVSPGADDEGVDEALVACRGDAGEALVARPSDAGEALVARLGGAGEALVARPGGAGEEFVACPGDEEYQQGSDQQHEDDEDPSSDCSEDEESSEESESSSDFSSSEDESVL